MFDAKFVRLTSEPRRVCSYVVEKSLVLFVVEVDDESVEELSQKDFNLVLSWLRFGQNRVNAPHLVAKGVVLLHDPLNGFRLSQGRVHNNTPLGKGAVHVGRKNCSGRQSNVAGRKTDEPLLGKWGAKNFGPRGREKRLRYSGEFRQISGLIQYVYWWRYITERISTAHGAANRTLSIAQLVYAAHALV